MSRVEARRTPLEVRRTGRDVRQRAEEPTRLAGELAANRIRRCDKTSPALLEGSCPPAMDPELLAMARLLARAVANADHEAEVAES